MKEKLTIGTTLRDLYGDKDYANHIEVDKSYWWYASEGSAIYEELKLDCPQWIKITVTLIRSGIVFYKCSDYPDSNELWFPTGSVMAAMVEVAELDPKKDLIHWHDINPSVYRFNDERTKLINWDNNAPIYEGEYTDYIFSNYDI